MWEMGQILKTQNFQCWCQLVFMVMVLSTESLCIMYLVCLFVILQIVTPHEPCLLLLFALFE